MVSQRVLDVVEGLKSEKQTEGTATEAFTIAAKDLEAAIQGLESHHDQIRNLSRFPIVEKLQQLTCMVISMSKSSSNTSNLVCLHNASLRDPSIADTDRPPYSTLFSTSGLCLWCGKLARGKGLRDRLRSIDGSFFADGKTLEEVGVRLWKRERPDPTGTFEAVPYLQANFKKAGSQWSHSLALSAGGAPETHVTVEPSTEAWQELLDKAPELWTGLERELEPHHDTLVMNMSGIASKLSTLNPEKSFQDIYSEVCQPIIALCDLFVKLREFRTGSERSASLRTELTSGTTTD